MMTAARAPQPPIQPRSEARRPWRRSRLPLSALALAAALAGGCGHGHGANKTSKPAEVIVTQPVTAELVDYQDFTGRLSAVKSVDMTARVSGYLEWIHFNEGDVVQKGAKLFSIDPRTYQAKYDKAVADLARSRATKKAADYEAVRQRDLMNKRAGAKTDLDLAVGKAEEAAAFVKYCESAVADVKIDLDYTLVTAPITGRISKYYITEGNLVMADKTLLTTIVSEDPIYVNFDVDERTLLNLLGPTYRKVGRLPDVRFPVLIRLANEDEFRFDPKHAGVVNFIDNQVTATSGTIRMRGVFHNPDGQLKAGLFARVRLPIGDVKKAILIPDEALMSDQGRKYVFVVNNKNEVIYRKVRPGQQVGLLREILPPDPKQEGKEGIKEGERIIVQGQQRVRPGAAVTVKTQPPPQAPLSPLVRLLTTTQQAAAKQKLIDAE